MVAQEGDREGEGAVEEIINHGWFNRNLKYICLFVKFDFCLFFFFPFPFTASRFHSNFFFLCSRIFPLCLLFWGSAELLSPLQQKRRSLIWAITVTTSPSVSLTFSPRCFFAHHFGPWASLLSSSSLSLLCLFSFSVCFSGLSGLSWTNNVRSEYSDRSGFGLLNPSSDLEGVTFCH